MNINRVRYQRLTENEEINIAWISKLAKQDWNLEAVSNLLQSIDDFIAQKEAETVAEIQLAKAFKAKLIEKFEC